jgi:hypothetical protein
LVHLKDETLDIYPRVTLEIGLPFDQEQTVRETRELAYERAKGMLRYALAALESTSLQSLDKAAREKAEAPLAFS